MKTEPPSPLTVTDAHPKRRVPWPYYFIAAVFYTFLSITLFLAGASPVLAWACALSAVIGLDKQS